MMVTIWGAAIVVFLIIEAVTVGIAAIWFALGSFCALIAALLGAPIWLQVAWFVVITAVTMVLTRPIVKKFVNGKKQATNADRVIGMRATVREEINNIKELLSKSKASISSFGNPNSESINFAFSTETGSFSFNSNLTDVLVFGLYSILISNYFLRYSCCKAVFSAPIGIAFISSRIATNSSLELAVVNLSVILSCSLSVFLALNLSPTSAPF